MSLHATNDYGTSGVPATRSSRPARLATYALHLVSSLIVLGISAYFVANFEHTTHLLYWVSVATVSTALTIPLLLLPTLGKLKLSSSPFALILSYLWLTAFIFATQDYDYNGGPFANSPVAVAKPALKKTLEAFAFIAFFTSMVGHVLEARIWDVKRVRGVRAHGAEKHVGGTAVEPPRGVVAV